MAEPNYDNPRQTRWLDNFITTLGLNPTDLTNSVQSGGTISFPHDIQSIEDVRKRFSDQGLPIPEYLMEYAAESWEDYQEIILGKPVKQPVPFQQRGKKREYGPVIPQDVINKTRELENKGYVRIGDSVPHIENGKDTKQWKEIWAKPKYGPVPQFGQDLDAAELIGGLSNAAEKEASRRDGDGNLVHPIQLGDAALPYDGESFWKGEWDKSLSRMVSAAQFFTQPGTTVQERLQGSSQEIGAMAPDMNPAGKAGMAVLSTAMPVMEVYDDITGFVAGYSSTQQIPYLGITPNRAAIERYEMLQSLDPHNIQSPDWAKRKEAYFQARDSGEVSFKEQIVHESVGDPLVWGPGGEVAGLIGGLGKKVLTQLTVKEIAKVAAKIESKAIRDALGPTQNQINPILNTWRKMTGTSGSLGSDYRGYANLLEFDPSVDLDVFGPHSVALRQHFMDSGVDEDSADLLTRVLGIESFNKYAKPDELASQIEVNKVSNAVANSALEQTLKLIDTKGPVGFTFKISEPENNVLGFKHVFEDWIDLFESIGDRSTGRSRTFTKAFYNPRKKSISKQGFLDYIEKNGGNLQSDGMETSDLLGRFSGLKWNRDEYIALGVESFIKNYKGKRIPLSELRNYIDQNRLQIVELKQPDLFSHANWGASSGGATINDGVIALSVDLENLSSTNPVVRAMLQADGDQLTTTLGHYGTSYGYDLDVAFGSAADDMPLRALELLNPNGPSVSSIPRFQHGNLMVTARYQVREINGMKVWHVDEGQSDLLQTTSQKMTNEQFEDNMMILFETSGREYSTSITDYARQNGQGYRTPDGSLYWDVDINGKRGGWVAGAFGDDFENIIIPADDVLGEHSLYGKAQSFFISPTTSDQPVEGFYNSIIDHISNYKHDGGFRPEVAIKMPNKGRDASWEGVEDFGGRVISEELFRMGDVNHGDYIRVQLLRESADTAIGVEKNPIIRITDYATHHIDSASWHGEKDVDYIHWHEDALSRLKHSTAQMITDSTQDPSIRRSIPQPLDRTRWSIEDILNNKAGPYRIVEEEGIFKIYQGGKYKRAYEYQDPNTVGLFRVPDDAYSPTLDPDFADYRIEWGAFKTREEAAKVLNDYLRTPGEQNFFNLPPNFIFTESNFHVPIMRRMLFNAADEGSDIMSISSALMMINKYGPDAKAYSGARYGDVSARGAKQEGILWGAVIDAVTDVMHTSGWSNWTNSDTEKLIDVYDMPIGQQLLPENKFMNKMPYNDIGNPILNETTPDDVYNISIGTNPMTAMGRLMSTIAHSNRKSGVLAGTESLIDDLNNFDSSILENLDHIPYELIVNDADPLVRNAIIDRLVNADVGEIAKQLERKITTPTPGPTSQPIGQFAELTDALMVLKAYTESLHNGWRPFASADNYPLKNPALMGDDTPNVLRILRDRKGLSLMNMIELHGIPVAPRTSGISDDDILRILLEESIDTVNPATDIVSKMRNPISLTARETDKVTPINGLRMTDNLKDAEVRKALGIKAIPDGDVHFMPSVQEALKNTQMRLFQINDQAPRGGRVMGYVDFTNDGKYLIRLTEAADSHTAMHEVGHIFRRLLTEDQLRTAGEFSMGREAFEGLANKNIWTTEGEEAFADAFESYLRTGYTRNPQMRTVFEQFKEWLKTIGRAIKGSPHEEKLNPQMKQFFDDLLTPNKPSIRKIESSVPPHMIDEVKKFYGYRVAGHNVADADGIDVIDRQFKVTDEPPITPPIEELDSLGSIEETLDAAFVEDLYRKVGEGLSNVPLAGAVIKGINPSAAATDPLARALIVREILKGQGSQKATIAISKLRRLGSRQQVFGGVNDEGLLTDGPLANKHLNDIRTRPDDYVLTPEQREWIDTADVLERAKLAMLKTEGIDINTLQFEEGGQYAGRRVFQKVLPDGTIIDSVSVGEKPIGTKQAYEKRRFYDTAAEAIADGFRYMEEDEALFRNLEAAYTQVADKKMVDYISANLNWRTTKVPENLIVDSKNAKDRLAKIKLVISELIRAKRGDQIHWQTRKAIEDALPELDGMLDDVSRITLEDLVEAGRIAADQPTSMVPKKGLIKKLFARVKELEDEIKIIESTGETPPASLIADLNVMKKKLGFQKHVVAEAYKNFNASPTGQFEYTFSRSVSGILSESRVGAIDELLEITRGKPYQHKVGEKVYTRYTGGMYTDVREEAIRTAQAVTKEREALAKGSYSESMIPKIPAFAGKIFLHDQPAWAGTVKGTDGVWRQRTGQEVVKAITDSMVANHQSYELMNAANTINGAMRFFRLAGDMSLFGIQLLFLLGHATNPTGLIKSVVTGKALRGDFSDARNMTFLPKAIKAYVHAFIDPTVHAKYLDENAELLNRHPGVLLAGRGTEFTEFTRQLTNAGFVRSRPIQITGNIARTIPGAELAGRGYMGFLKRTQTGFEAAMDIAGIEMLKSLDDLGTDAVKIGEVDAFVNEFRGLADTARLGVSAKQRQIESFALLAPRYNRAIAAMIADLARGGIRGSQARRKMASGIAAISALSVAISLARGEEPDEMLEHFNPQSAAFMTWNVGGVNIGFGTKVRSLIKLSAALHMEMTDDQEMDFWSMENPLLRFARGNSAPLLGSSIDILTGRTYMGDPTRDSVMSFASNVIAPASMFIWTSSMLLEGGSMKQRAIRGMIEFLGGRSHPETMSQVLNTYSKDTLGLDYDELEPFERKMLRALLAPTLGPMQEEQLMRGSEYAKYYHERDALAKDRMESEADLVHQYMNPNTGSGIFLSSNADRIFKTKYNDIQSAYAVSLNDLNEQHEMYQDDQEFEEDNPKGYVLQEWYNLYEKAYRTADTEAVPNELYQGIFDTKLLARLEKEFWNSTLPNGEPMTNYVDFIHRNTGTTEHAPGVSTILGSDVQQQWDMTQKAQQAFLKDRGNWNDVLDKSK